MKGVLRKVSSVLLPILALIIILLMFFMFSEKVYTVDELMLNAKKLLGKKVKVRGVVDDINPPDSFYLSGEKKKIKVVWRGNVSVGMEGRNCYVVGKLKQNGGYYIDAMEVRLGCPSK